MDAASKAQAGIKGAAVRQMLVWLQGELDEGKLQQIGASMQGPGHEIHPDLPAFGILSSLWYPAPMLHGFCDELTRDLTREEARRLARDGAASALERSLGKFHRILLRKIASPQLHRLLAQRLWNVHFDSGEVEVELPAAGRSLVRYRNWSSHHRFICDMCTASDLGIYGAMGLQDVRVQQTTCIDNGDDDCTHRVTWAT